MGICLMKRGILMYFQGKCRSCKKNISFEYALMDGERDLFCPECRTPLTRIDAEHLYALTEKYSNTERVLTSVELNGIHSGSTHISMNRDFDMLKNAYHQASPAIKGEIGTIIDQMYLMLFGAIKNDDAQLVSIIRAKMETVFNWHIDMKNAELYRLLDEEPSQKQ